MASACFYESLDFSAWDEVDIKFVLAVVLDVLVSLSGTPSGYGLFACLFDFVPGAYLGDGFAYLFGLFGRDVLVVTRVDKLDNVNTLDPPFP